MTSSIRLPARAIFPVLVVAPIGVMTVLSIMVLLPALRNPESKFYGSSIGYPAFQRLIGQPIEVQTATAKYKDVEDSVAAPGESMSLQQVDIRPLVSGTVEKVYVKEGQRVKKGQPLVQIERSTFIDNLNEAKNDLAIAEAKLRSLQVSTPIKLRQLETELNASQARMSNSGDIAVAVNEQSKHYIEEARGLANTSKKKLEQIEILTREGAISKFQLYNAQDEYASRLRDLRKAQNGYLTDTYSQYNVKDFSLQRQREVLAARQNLELTQKTAGDEIEKARLDFETQQLRLKQATRDLSRTIVYANMDGLVSQTNIHTGELADAKTKEPLLTLSQDIVFRAFVDQARLNAIKVGDTAAVRLVAYPGKTFQGKVMQVNPTVATNASKSKLGGDRQYTYSVWVSVEGVAVPPGLQGFVQFSQGKTSLMVPESAVTHLSSGEGMVMVAGADDRAQIRKVKLGRVVDKKREVLEGLTEGDRVVLTPRALNPGDKLAISSKPTT
jgi:HlyD family secretion protein